MNKREPYTLVGPTITRPVQDPLTVNSSRNDYLFSSLRLLIYMMKFFNDGNLSLGQIIGTTLGSINECRFVLFRKGLNVEPEMSAVVRRRAVSPVCSRGCCRRRRWSQSPRSRRDRSRSWSELFRIQVTRRVEGSCRSPHAAQPGKS